MTEKEISFDNQLTKEDLLRVNRVWTKVYGKVRRNALLIACIVPLLGMFNMIYNMYKKLHAYRTHFFYDPNLAYYKFEIIFLIIYLIFLLLLVDAILFWARWLTQRDLAHEENAYLLAKYQIKVTDKMIEAKDEQVKISYQWDAIQQVILSETEILLLTAYRQGIFLRKDALSKDQYEAFFALCKENIEDRILVIT